MEEKGLLREFIDFLETNKGLVLCEVGDEAYYPTLASGKDLVEAFLLSRQPKPKGKAK